MNKTSLTGYLLVTIDDSNFSVNMGYSNVLLNGNPLRSADTLTTDSTGINSSTLTSGRDGYPNYSNYGSAVLSPFPFICVECGYEMTLNLTATPLSGNPLVLSYHEYNPFDTGAVDFELFVSQVPLPAAVWLFAAGLISILSLGRHKHT